MVDTAQFSAGLLNPLHPVPSIVKGQVERRYAVYRNNVTVGLVRALEANFPAVRRLLGEQYFAGFAREFAQSFPPQSPLMFEFGEGFPDALRHADDLKAYPYLADVAHLEILWRKSYHAADVAPLAASALALVDPEDLFYSTFVVHPATHLLHSDFAIHDLFIGNRDGGSGHVNDPSRSQSVLISRPQYEVLVTSMTLAEFSFFKELVAGNTLANAVDCAFELDENFDVTAILALLLKSGAFKSHLTKGEKFPC